MNQTSIRPKSDLTTRTLSAAVMLLVAGTALWFGGYIWFVFVAVVAAVCLVEFIRLIFMATDKLARRIFGSIVAVIYVGFAGFALAEARHAWLHDDDGHLGLVAAISLIGIVVWTDIGAYFSGRAIGGPKIAPKISPSKTWAGLIGGMTAAAFWSAISMYIFATIVDPLDYYTIPVSKWIWALAVGAFLAVFAQIGDFFESWLKRCAGVKDSSKLIPGHGGVFDRIDGLLSVVIVSTLFNLRPF